MAKNVRKKPRYERPCTSNRIRTNVRRDADTHAIREGEYFENRTWMSSADVELFVALEDSTSMVTGRRVLLMPRKGGEFALCQTGLTVMFSRRDIVPVLAFPEYATVSKTATRRLTWLVDRETALKLNEEDRYKARADSIQEMARTNCTKCFDCTLHQENGARCKKGIKWARLTSETVRKGF